jgi:hypothetical protein
VGNPPWPRSPLKPTLAPHVMAGLDPAIGYPHQFANDAIPVSNHPIEMTGSSPVMTGLDRCVWYVNSKGGWLKMHGHRWSVSPTGPALLSASNSKLIGE